MNDDILATLAAERQIRRLIARYGQAVAERNAGMARDLFAEDARVQIAHLPERVGRDAAIEGFGAQLGNFRFLDQKSDLGVIDVDGDRAKGRFQVIEFNEHRTTGEVAMITGWYEDDYVRRDGKWLFHRRRFTLASRTVVANTHSA